MPGTSGAISWSPFPQVTARGAPEPRRSGCEQCLLARLFHSHQHNPPGCLCNTHRDLLLLSGHLSPASSPSGDQHELCRLAMLGQPSPAAFQSCLLCRSSPSSVFAKAHLAISRAAHGLLSRGLTVCHFAITIGTLRRAFFSLPSAKYQLFFSPDL